METHSATHFGLRHRCPSAEHLQNQQYLLSMPHVVLELFLRGNPEYRLELRPINPHIRAKVLSNPQEFRCAPPCRCSKSAYARIH